MYTSCTFSTLLPFQEISYGSGQKQGDEGSKTEGGDRDKAIKLALDQIERQFGKGSIMTQESRLLWMSTSFLREPYRLTRRWALEAYRAAAL